MRSCVARRWSWRITDVVSHDSYLINLASPDPALRRRSEASFAQELTRCSTLDIPWVVSHPGNFMDDRDAGLERNAESYARCLAQVPGTVRVAIETTAGSGTALGARFEVRLGYRVREVGVEWRNDPSSRVRLWRDGPRMLLDVVRFRWRHRALPAVAGRRGAER